MGVCGELGECFFLNHEFLEREVGVVIMILVKSVIVILRFLISVKSLIDESGWPIEKRAR